MKRPKVFLLTVVFAFVLTATVIPQNNAYTNPNLNYGVIERNYMMGLNSGNRGLMISCAFFLGEMRSKRAVIPLMKMMATEDHEGARIIAAWSLIKIGDPRGINRVRREAELSSCCSVQCMCEYFYKQYLTVQKLKIADRQ